MMLPDGRALAVEDGVLVERTTGEGRVVLWVPGIRAEGFQHWERVGTAAAATVSTVAGICSVAAVLTPARQRSGNRLSAALRRLAGSNPGPSWTLPDGGTCERSGSRRTDIVLAWAEAEAGPLDEGRVRGRWPGAREVRRIGRDLFLVEGVAPEQEGGPVKTEAAPGTELPPVIPSLQLAAHALAEARQAGDRAREVTALIDLAVSYLYKLEAEPAASLLEEALDGARQLGDKARELDATLNYAQAVLILGRPQQVIELLEPALVAAREADDRYTEKVVLERLGHGRQALGDHVMALGHFDQALALARDLGDAQHEATLLWYAGIAFAELGQAHEAIARGEAAVHLLHRMNKPQAVSYAQHLADYRASIAPPGPAARDGGAFDTSVVTINPQPHASASAAAGPGLLRMALTATKAAVAFAGSGLKTVPVETYRARMARCTSCELFTGLRCRVCGCVPAVKARLPYEDCPAGKWEP